MISIKEIRDITEEPYTVFQERELAFEKYNTQGLPEKKDAWKFIDTSKIIPEKIILGEQVIRMHITQETINNKIIWCDLKTALKDYYIALKDYLRFNSEDKFLSMCSAFWNDGLFIYIPKRAIVSTPLLNEFMVRLKGSIFTKIVLILDEGSSASIYDSFLSNGDGFYRLEDIDVILMPNSSLNYYRQFKLQDNAKNITNIRIELMEKSNANVVLGQSGGILNRTKLDMAFIGEGGKAVLSAIVYGKNKQKIDLTTNSTHISRGTSCNVLVKGAIDNYACSVYRGKIKIEKDAQKTTSYLEDHVLMLSKDATSYSIPSLEIDANDVKASHGATQGKPSEEEIFYLMARGLKKNEAEKIIVSGFFTDVLTKIKDNKIKEDFEKLFEVQL